MQQKPAYLHSQVTLKIRVPPPSLYLITTTFDVKLNSRCSPVDRCKVGTGGVSEAKTHTYLGYWRAQCTGREWPGSSPSFSKGQCRSISLFGAGLVN